MLPLSVRCEQGQPVAKCMDSGRVGCFTQGLITHMKRKTDRLMVEDSMHDDIGLYIGIIDILLDTSIMSNDGSGIPSVGNTAPWPSLRDFAIAIALAVAMAMANRYL